MTSDETLRKIKKFVCDDSNYRLSSHVRRDYIDKDLCSIDDIKHCIRNANSIYSRAIDEMGTSVDNTIYTIIGENTFGTKFYTAGKFIKTEDGETYFFVTAHETEE